MLILIAFVLLNLAVFTHTPTVDPDEPQFADPSANLALGSGFTSTMWGQDRHELCITYVPLYHAALALFFKLFGVGLFSARALNLVLTAGGGLLIWKALQASALIRQPAGRLLCLGLIWSGSASTLAFRIIRPDAMMFFVCAALFFAGCVPRNRWVQGALVFGISGLAPAAHLPLLPYIGTILILYFVIFRGKNLRLLILTGLGMVAGIFAVLALYGCFSTVQNYLNLVHAGSGGTATASFWHDKIFGTRPGDSNLFNSFFGSPLELFRKDTLFDHSAFLFFWVAIALSLKLWGKADGQTRKLTVLILAIALTVPPLLHFTGHYFYYYRWMTYMPLAMLIPRLLENCEMCGLTGIRRAGLLVAGLGFFLGAPARTLMALPDWSQRSIEPIVAAAKTVVRADDVVICDYKTYFAIRPQAQLVFAYGVTAFGDFTLIKNLPTNDVTLLALCPAEVKPVFQRVGGVWEKVPLDKIPAAAALVTTRYAVDFYRRRSD